MKNEMSLRIFITANDGIAQFEALFLHYSIAEGHVVGVLNIKIGQTLKKSTITSTLQSVKGRSRFRVYED